MSPRFDVHLERESFGAGDMVRGTIVVTKGGRSRSIEALLEYCEETTDYKSAARTFSSGALHTGDLTEGMTFAFNVPLPVDALPNQRSEHGELYWEIQVKSDERGPDTHERRRVVVLPPAPPRPPGAPGSKGAGGMTAGRLVDQFVERVWRRRDLDGIVDLFAEDYELATVAGGQVRAQRAGRLPAG